MERNTGETSRQIIAAPRGAVFIWCNDHLWYVQDMAAALGRTDVIFRTPRWLDVPRLARNTVVIVDHAAKLSQKQRSVVDLFSKAAT